MTRRLWFLALGLMVVATGCGELLEPAAAVVHGDKITTSEVSDAVERFESSKDFQRVAARGEDEGVLKRFERGYLSALIEVTVLREQAEELDVNVDDDVEDQIDSVRSEYPSDEEFEQAIEDQGFTLEQLEDVIFRRDALVENLRAEVTKDAAPSPDEVSAYYEKHINDFSSVRVSHIQVSSVDEAARLAAMLKKAGRKRVEDLFARLAARFSIDESSAQQGGDLGANSVDSFLRPFAAAVEDLDEGEVSDPVETNVGYHVIYLADRDVRTLSEVGDEIAEEIGGEAQEEAWQQWRLDVFEAADIEVNPRYGEFDLATQQVVDPTAEDVPGAEVVPTSSPPAPSPTG